MQLKRVLSLAFARAAPGRDQLSAIEGSVLATTDSAAREANRTRLRSEAAEYKTVGRFGDALALLNRAIETAPDDPRLALARASTLFAWGRVSEAIEGYLHAASLGLQDGLLFVQLGWSHLHLGRPADAEPWMRKAVLIDPPSFDAQLGVAAALTELGRFDDAVEHFERALERCPNNFDALIMLGGCRVGQGEPHAAEVEFRRAIAVDARKAVAWSNLGVALRCQYRHDDALEAFKHAVELAEETREPGDGATNLARQLHIMGRTTEALATHEKNLGQNPDADAHRAYAHALLSAGRLLEGWNHYEFRWMFEPLLSCRAGPWRPPWSGQDLRGKTIVLRMEQGFGDTIQFLRYAPYVKALGATVLLRWFSDLAYGFAGVDRVIGVEESPQFDYYIPLMSLPRVFATDLSSIPAGVPYVQAEPRRVDRWAERLGGDCALRVGLVWAGSPAHPRDIDRSIPLRALSPIIGLNGVRFFSLQKGPQAAEAQAFSGAGFTDLGPALDDFADTAAVISQLDLIIAVDTAVAHLAGALGKPVWLMLQKDADWRWLEKRDDSPWYPTMRLLRQSSDSQPGDWSGVVEQIREALQRVLGDASTSRLQVRASSRPVAMPPTPVAHEVPVRATRPGLSAVTETRVGILQFLPDEPIVGESIGWYGEFLHPQLELLAGMIPTGASVLEADAGVGAHAIFLATAVGPTGRLLLYESDPVRQCILRQNLAANRAHNVTVMSRALGSACSKELQGRSDTGPRDDTPPPNLDTIDDLQLERLQLIKLNSATRAIPILEGAARTLWRLRPMVFVAAPDDGGIAAFASRLGNHGYRCWRMEIPLFNSANFNRRDYDIFGGRTALALLATAEEAEVNIAFPGCVAFSC